jgi:hypothetical protein
MNRPAPLSRVGRIVMVVLVTHPERMMRPCRANPTLAPMTPRPWTLSAEGRRLAAMFVVTVTAAMLLAGCGSGSSSTPAASSSTPAASSSTPAASSGTPTYCTDVNALKSAVAQLGATGTPSTIVVSIKKVETSGQLAISKVKTAFAAEVGALKSSLAALANSAKQLTSSSTRTSALQQLPAEVTAVKAAAGKFVNATKCG